MTQMLASVTSVAEALLALELGADIIDLKNPHEGALGALPLATLASIVTAIDGRRTVSATIGDIPDHPASIAQKVVATAATGVDIVKIGIAASRSALAFWHSAAWLGSLGPKAHARLATTTWPEPASTRLVAVLFADEGIDLAWIDALAASGFYGVMLDTADKQGGGLRRHCDDALLRNFVQRAQEKNLMCGLAGSLRLDDIAPLLALSPDYLGFRGALCRNTSRTDQLDADAFREVRARMLNSAAVKGESEQRASRVA
jgi:(5-formylfuran-3-yl)methyl phosphate synthase